MAKVVVNERGNEVTDANIGLTRPEVVEWEPSWLVNRAFRSGSKDVRKLGENVLPKLDPEQSDEEYQVYLDQAILYEASVETADAWGGLIFQKDPVILINGDNPSDELDEKLTHITNSGMSTTALLREIVDEVITVNRYGVLIDYPVLTDEEMEMSRQQQLELGLSSKAMTYKAESIINWHTEIINNESMLTLLVLREVIDGFDTENFVYSKKIQYRVLTLESTDETDSGLRYNHKLYIEDTGDGKSKENPKYEKTLDVYPTIDTGNGPEYLEKIPFWVFRKIGTEEISEIKSALLGSIVEMNKGHFRNSADYENEIHKVSIKTPVIPGGVMEDTDLRMGGVIQTQFPDARPFMLESGNASPLDKEMENKEKRMVHLGAKALGNNNAQITAETARIQAASEESVLGSLANAVSDDFEDMLAFKLLWDMGEEYSVSVELNTDYFTNEIQLAELQQAWMWVTSGGGSFDAYYALLDKRNAYPKGHTKEKEIELIKETQALIADIIPTPKVETVDLGTQILDEEGNVITQNGNLIDSTLNNLEFPEVEV